MENKSTCHMTNVRMIDVNVANADSCETAKIKSPFVKVIVTGSEDKPYYEILYYDPSDGKCHIGYSSFSLNTVFHYLSEVFDIADVPIVDAVPVVHGYWIDSHSVDHIGRITGHGIDCSVCDSVFKDDSRAVVKHWKEQFKVCPFCGAVMDGDGND